MADWCFAEALAPHELLQVCLQQPAVGPVARIVSLLGLLPHALDVVRGSVRDGVQEVQLMVDSQVLITMFCDRVVGRPQIRNYRSS